MASSELSKTFNVEAYVSDTKASAIRNPGKGEVIIFFPAEVGDEQHFKPVKVTEGVGKVEAYVEEVDAAYPWKEITMGETIQAKIPVAFHEASMIGVVSKEKVY